MLNALLGCYSGENMQSHLGNTHSSPNIERVLTCSEAFQRDRLPTGVCREGLPCTLSTGPQPKPAAFLSHNPLTPPSCLGLPYGSRAQNTRSNVQAVQTTLYVCSNIPVLAFAPTSSPTAFSSLLWDKHRSGVWRPELCFPSGAWLPHL